MNLFHFLKLVKNMSWFSWFSKPTPGAVQPAQTQGDTTTTVPKEEISVVVQQETPAPLPEETVTSQEPKETVTSVQLPEETSAIQKPKEETPVAVLEEDTVKMVSSEPFQLPGTVADLEPPVPGETTVEAPPSPAAPPSTPERSHSIPKSETAMASLCHRCGKVAKPSNCANIVENNMLYLYHIECFTCAKCSSSLLASLRKFVDGDVVGKCHITQEKSKSD